MGKPNANYRSISPSHTCCISLLHQSSLAFNLHQQQTEVRNPTMEPKRSKPIVEEREERMICITGGKPTFRRGRFLNPSVISVEEAMEVPLAPLLSETISPKSKACPLRVQFKGWRVPMKKWKQWVDKLVPLHGTIWKKTCIYDAIMGSTYEVRKCENAVLGLAEFWCPGTNTFVFPWGEASITLEDVLILGGFSLLGEPVTSSLDRNLIEINEIIIKEYTEFGRNHSSNKPEYHFMESKDIDRNIEHVAFLALWLSRYVFPRQPHDIVGKHVFSIAIHLAHGTRIALAPAVLSSLYRDLGLLTRNATAYNDVWAPFHIVQMWVWEHFLLLSPVPHSLGEGEPRVARWNKLSSSLELISVRNVMKISENFQWRCYARHVRNWQHPLFYKEKEMWVVYDSNIDDGELRSFSRCLRASELVGIDCIEQYLPHRVAMQFGLDQDLPGYFTRANSRWEDAWITYDKSIEEAEFYIPPRLFESDVTTRYLDWWKQSMITRKGRCGDNAKQILQPTRVESKRKETSSVCPGAPFMDKRQKLQEKESNVCRDTETRRPSLHSNISKETGKKKCSSTTATKKVTCNKGSKNADSSKNGKTAGKKGLESRVLNLERGMAEIKAILKSLKEDEA